MTASSLDDLRVKIFADGADLQSLRQLASDPRIKGFTTNPTLMRSAGVRDYRAFAAAVLDVVGGRPVSFEVFADDFETMELQAREIASWGPNVFVKIPVMNTRAEFAGPLIAALSRSGVKLNVTAVMTLDQIAEVTNSLAPAVPAIVSMFAGRIADTGVDPVPHMKLESPGTVEHLSGGCNRLSRHHSVGRFAEQAVARGTRPHCVLEGNSGDVSQRRHGRRVQYRPDSTVDDILTRYVCAIGALATHYLHLHCQSHLSTQTR
jgi:transaldolase